MAPRKPFNPNDMYPTLKFRAAERLENMMVTGKKLNALMPKNRSVSATRPESIKDMMRVGKKLNTLLPKSKPRTDSIKGRIPVTRQVRQSTISPVSGQKITPTGGGVGRGGARVEGRMGGAGGGEGGILGRKKGVR
jgi:hypothetical protein